MAKTPRCAREERMRKAGTGWLLAVVLAATSHGQSRPRARDLDLAPGAGSPGAQNAITDVAGVAVGHVTVVQGDAIRTGVTAVLPHGGNLFREKVPGAVFVGTIVKITNLASGLNAGFVPRGCLIS